MERERQQGGVGQERYGQERYGQERPGHSTQYQPERQHEERQSQTGGQGGKDSERQRERTQNR
jgi:hypothetical protein